MKQFQEKFIFEYLKTYKICEEIKNTKKDQLKNISTQIVSKILDKKYCIAPDMKAVLCLFNTLFLSVSNNVKEEDGIYFLNKDIQNFLKEMTELSVDSAEGFVYITQFFSKDIKVIIKVSRTLDGESSLLREYFLGITSINKLRYLIPTFVYTFGSFLCERPVVNKIQDVNIDY